MLANMKARRDREEGFTLIELMVVVLIIAILIAIAIPTFLGARQRAQERAAQSSLRNAVTAAKTLYTDDENFNAIGADEQVLESVEPSLSYADSATDSTGPKDVSVVTNDLSGDGVNDDAIAMSALSRSGDCFFILDVVAGSSSLDGTYFAEGAGNACSAADAPAHTTAAEIAANWDSDGW
jgi:type IV pilus assembly protein PilA